MPVENETSDPRLRACLLATAFEGVTGRTPMAPPLSLATVAAATPDWVKVSIIDGNLEPIKPDQIAANADVVGITAVTHTATQAYEVADALRARSVKVVLGGMHPSALPEEALQHADAVVVGEAENVWGQLLEDVLEGRLQQVYHNQKRPLLTSVKTPRHDLLSSKGYLFPNSVYTTRGCPNGCEFCEVTSFYGNSYRFRSENEVLAEIHGLPGRLLFIVDDNIAGHRGRAKDFFRGMAAEKRSWIGQASLTMARDEELLAEAAASGCIALFVGIESLSQQTLVSVGKHCNNVNEYEKAIGLFHKYGIGVFAGFIFGFDNDTPKVFEQTLEFAKRNRIEGAQFNILTPYPGTKLFAKMEEDGRLLHRDWSKYRANNVVFKTECMPATELTEGRNWTEEQFFRLPSIWERLGAPKNSRDLAMWLVNLNYRKNDPVSKAILQYGVPAARRLFSF